MSSSKITFRILFLSLAYVTKKLTESATAFSDVVRCCEEAGISQHCTSNLCQPAPDVNLYKNQHAYELAKRCQRWELDRASQCLSDGRNHSVCCQQQAPHTEQAALCLHVCSGQPLIVDISDELSDAYKEYTSCLVLNFQEAVLPCLAQGYLTLPGPPEQLRVQNVTQNRADLAWSPPKILPEVAEFYLVYYFDNLQNSSPRFASTRGTNLRLENLHPNVNYSFYVVSNGRRGSSLRSVVGHFVTGAQATVESYQKRVLAPVGGTATLICQVRLEGTVRRAVESSWLRLAPKGNQFLSLSDGSKFETNLFPVAESSSQLHKNHTEYVSVLFIKQISSEDFGVYKCSVISAAGVKEQSIRLESPGDSANPPTIPPDLLECCEREGVSRRCLALCNNDPDQAAATISELRNNLCSGQVNKISHCLTGLFSRTTGACCLRRRVPFRCLDLCVSGVSVLFARGRSKFEGCAAFNTEIFECIIETKSGAPHPPEGMRFSRANNKVQSNTLSWEKSEMAESYFIYYKQLRPTLARNWTRIRTKANNIFMPDLQRGALYKAAILAYNSFGFSDSSRFIEISA